MSLVRVTALTGNNRISILSALLLTTESSLLKLPDNYKKLLRSWKPHTKQLHVVNVESKWRKCHHMYIYLCLLPVAVYEHAQVHVNTYTRWLSNSICFNVHKKAYERHN